MKRLTFKLPEFAPRMTWTSAHARSVWEPRMSRVSNAFVEAERMAVIQDKKPSALQAVSPDRLAELTRELAPHGVVVIPLGKVARAAGYVSATQPLAVGAPFDYRVAVTRPAHVERWTEAWAKSDNDAMGLLLGYPRCCRRFFQRVWVEEHWFDTTYPMAHGETDVAGTNMLLRWFGIRPVSHLPCRFDCEDTARQAIEMIALMPVPERSWLLDLLEWPTRWSSLHGVAEVFTPVFRAIVPTDALATVAEVRFLGSVYPDEGATGVTFPYRKSVPIKILRPALKNGFLTEAAMHAAHEVLLNALPETYYPTVIDLGCGDGTLLKKVAASRRVGVEREMTVKTTGLDRTVYMDCTDRVQLARLLAEERPDLIIAQRHRNPLESLAEYDVLSYSYELGTTATFVKARVSV